MTAKELRFTEKELRTPTTYFYRIFELFVEGEPAGFWYEFPRRPKEAAVSAFIVEWGAVMTDGTLVTVGHIDAPRRLTDPDERAEWFGEMLLRRNINCKVILKQIGIDLEEV